jgi:hypothetical protein
MEQKRVALWGCACTVSQSLRRWPIAFDLSHADRVGKKGGDLVVQYVLTALSLSYCANSLQ